MSEKLEMEEEKIELIATGDSESMARLLGNGEWGFLLVLILRVAFKCLNVKFSVTTLAAWLEAFKCLIQSLL